MGSLAFLVVDDDPLVQRALAVLFRKHGAATAAFSVSAGMAQLDTRWDGIVIDVRLRDGSGLEVLAEARKRRTRTPAVVLSGIIDREVVNAVAKLDARLVAKPFGRPELAAFITDAGHFSASDRIDAAVERARHRWMLTAREVVIIQGALQNRTRDDNAEELGITANTYKSHVRRLLDKTDYANLSSLAIDLLVER